MSAIILSQAQREQIADAPAGRLALSQRTDDLAVEVEHPDGRRITYHLDGSVKPSVWAGPDRAPQRAAVAAFQVCGEAVAVELHDGHVTLVDACPAGDVELSGSHTDPGSKWEVEAALLDDCPIQQHAARVAAALPAPAEDREHEPFCELQPDHKHGCYVTPAYLRGA